MDMRSSGILSFVGIMKRLEPLQSNLFHRPVSISNLLLLQLQQLHQARICDYLSTLNDLDLETRTFAPNLAQLCLYYRHSLPTLVFPDN